MMRRERVLARRRRSRGRNPRSKVLGLIADVRARVPLVVEFGGEPFRIVELEGRLVAHAATCPHWLGPLDQAMVVDGCIRCPWHGYRFDVRTGASADGRGLSLPRAPEVVIVDGQVSLKRADA
jgi:nitrite reductase/ring-hydroxylating ferredoxin subunit